MTKEDLEKVVCACSSYRNVARKLGRQDHQRLKVVISELGIDTSHFTFGKVSTGYIGQKFSKLTIVSVRKERRRWYCIAHCDCGGTLDARLDNIVSFRVPSCGCISRNRPTMLGHLNPSFAGVGQLRAAQFGKIKRSAERRGIPFDITLEYAWSLFEAQNGRCALSNIEIEIGRIHFCHETNASLDRIDSSKGYIIGNVQWVHKDVNFMKKTYDQGYFIEMCRAIAAANT